MVIWANPGPLYLITLVEGHPKEKLDGYLDELVAAGGFLMNRWTDQPMAMVQLHKEKMEPFMAVDFVAIKNDSMMEKIEPIGTSFDEKKAVDGEQTDDVAAEEEVTEEAPAKEAAPEESAEHQQEDL